MGRVTSLWSVRSATPAGSRAARTPPSTAATATPSWPNSPPAGTPLWSTYLGGTGEDTGTGIALDKSGNIFVCGTTASSGWTSGGFQTTYGGSYDAFVVKLSPAGRHLWSTYLGGAKREDGYGLAVDASGNVFITGATYSSGWIKGNYLTSPLGAMDVFVTKLSTTGLHLWSTYLGGGNDDCGYAIAVDASGNAAVTGQTASTSWIADGYTDVLGGGIDGFLIRLSPLGLPLWSTYLGGSDTDQGQGVAIDAARQHHRRRPHLVQGLDPGRLHQRFRCPFCRKILQRRGRSSGNPSSPAAPMAWPRASPSILSITSSSPVTPPPPGWAAGGFDDNYKSGGTDAFVSELLPSGRPVWSSCLGGSGADYANDLAVNARGEIAVAGYTTGGNWSMNGTETTYRGGSYDGFLARIQQQALLVGTVTPPPD